MSASKWKSYPEYKSTNVEWIPKIPTNWKVISAKRIFQNSKQLNKGLQSIERLSLTMNGVIERPIDDATGLQPTEFETYQLFEKDDLVFKLIDLENIKTSRVGIVPKNGIMSPAYIRILNNLNRNMRFYYFQYLDLYLRNILNDIGSAGVRSNISASQLLEFPIIEPGSRNEENQISQFCDSVDSIFSEIKLSLKSYLHVLEEKRSALITQAVTKGLNLNVPMKDSGIDWIGNIPRHWNTRKVKHLFQLMNEPSNASHGMELLSVYTAIGVRPRKSLEQKGNKATSTDGYWLVQKEDLVVNKLLAWMGAIGRSEYDGVTSPAYDILRPLRDTVTEYYHFLFRCGICLPEFKKRSRGIMEMRLRLYFEELGSIEVPCPPPEEQQEIADYIRNLDDTQIDLETGINKQIEMLTEYRISLISAAVTGKIDVRGQA
jgi:type I restriction enzyme, S subunit